MRSIIAKVTAKVSITNFQRGPLDWAESPAAAQQSTSSKIADLFNRAAELVSSGDNYELRRLLQTLPDTFANKKKTEPKLAKETDDEQGWNLAHLAAAKGSDRPAVACKTIELLADAFGPDYVTKIKATSGATPVHLAAWRLDNLTMAMLKNRFGLECFEHRDDSKRSVAYYAAHNPNESTFEWMLNNLPIEIFIIGNLSGTNALHACAEQRSVRLIQLARDKLGGLSGFLHRGYLGRTAVMYATKNRGTPSAMEWFVQQLGSKCLEEQDERKNSPVHLVAWFRGAESLRSIRRHLGDLCFTWRDAEGRTAVHCAAANETALAAGQEAGSSAFLWLLSDEASAFRMTLGTVDDEGRNCLHYCAANRRYGEAYFRLAAEALGFATPSAAVSGSIDRQGRNPVFIACLLKNFDFLAADFVQPSRQACTDQCGNTLLHALFQQRKEFWSRDFDIDRFVSEFERFQTECKISLTAENSSKLNCLMSAEISGSMLVGVLEKLAQNPAKYKPLLTNSEGLHVVHVFALKYELSKLENSLLKLAGNQTLEPSSLMSTRMQTNGPLKGTTCLHLACEAGHEANIRYLTGLGLKLADETEAGQTCVDLAYNKGRIDALLGAVSTSESNSGLDLAEVLRLVDPAERSLQLPERDTAQRLLTSYSADSTLSATGSDKKDEIEMDGQRYSAQMMLLARAFELNSTDMLRSLMVLGHFDGINEASFCQLFRARLHQSKKSATMNDWFPDLVPQILERPGISIIDVAVLTSRDGILSDLVMTSQFDIVPTCLRVLINIRPVVQQQKGKHDQMNRLADRLTATLVNLLDQLYMNADNKQKELVNSYLTGGFFKEIAINDEAIRYDYGPKFTLYPPLTSSDKEENLPEEPQYLTVLELIDQLDSEALFASECLSKLTKELWLRREPFLWQKKYGAGDARREDRTSGCSVRARFVSFVISYFLFLAYFSWYLTDFARTFANAAPDTLMWLFAAALTAHEIADMATTRQPVQFYWWNRRLTVPRYATDFYNYCDLLALLFLWVGLGLKAGLFASMSGDSYGCLVTLATSFLLWGFRTLRLLAYQKKIGPKVSMLQCLLLDDLGPFLSILAVIIVSFGVFFLALLYPALTVVNGAPASAISRPVWPTVREILSFPGFVAFAMYQKTDLTSCPEESIVAGYTANLTCVHPHGREAFNGFMLFVFLLLVNIVMWNLLIALFSLSVSRLASKTVVIWRKTSYDMLQQFRVVSFLPLPLSLLDYAIIRPVAALLKCCNKQAKRRVRPQTGLEESNSAEQNYQKDQNHPEWWRRTDSMEGYPEEYRSFLIYQALQLRQCRPTLQQGLEKHQSDYDGLRAHNENILAASTRNLVKDVTASFSRELKSRQSEGDQRLTQIEEQLNKQRRAQKKLEKQMKEIIRALTDIQHRQADS